MIRLIALRSRPPLRTVQPGRCRSRAVRSAGDFHVPRLANERARAKQIADRRNQLQRFDGLDEERRRAGAQGLIGSIDRRHCQNRARRPLPLGSLQSWNPSPAERKRSDQHDIGRTLLE